MCGIIGGIWKEDIVSLLINGLKKLEYRGYDSAGMCISENNNLYVIKRKGKIEELENALKLENVKSNIGIAHTRWATHGEPNEKNAHPHLDCKKEIAIVHNGIIENYNALKELLIKEGHKIISDTDSEIIAHLIEKFDFGNLEEAVIESLKLVEGTFGLAIMKKNEDKIIVAKRGSPLIIGLCDNGILVTSDSVAILDYTKKVIYLHDNEIGVLSKDSYVIKNINGDVIDKKIEEIKWTIEQIEKKGFKHFMLKEIFEQPDSIENTLRGRLKGDKIKLSVENISSTDKIIITACGTSWHSALIGKYIIEKLTGISVEVDYASEFRYRNPVLKENDVIVVISQSGETADTLAALKESKSNKLKTIGIVNTIGSTISREVDSGIYLHAGPEIGVASTKAFTCQVIALLLLALNIRQNKGFNLDKNLLTELENIPEKIREVLEKADKIKEIANNFKDSKNFLYLGRGINFPVALEGALKLKEISYIHAEGYPAAEMKHGPIALIDENMPAVFLATSGPLFEKVLSNMQEVKARKGKIITITDEENEVINKLSDYIIKVPKISEELSPIINVIPLQLLAYYIADAKGLNIDKPRNLAKSVTVE